MKKPITVAGRTILIVAKPIRSAFTTRWEGGNNYHEFRTRQTFGTAKEALNDEEARVRNLFVLRAAI